MSNPPDFRELVGDDLPAAERERLERVHEMLVAAGPPPELPPELALAPSKTSASPPTWLPRRRAGATIALAAAIALIAFLGGYIAGHTGRGSTFDTVRSVKLGDRQASAVVRFGPQDENGNTPMLVKVEGLRKLPSEDYYTLFMTKGGRRVVPCGSFRVRDTRSTTLHFTVAYDPSEFDGLQLVRYRHSDHKDVPLFSETTVS